MNYTLRAVVVAATWLCCASASAQVQVLGVEIGTSTVQQVKTEAAKQSKVRDIGTNKWSQGPMLRADGDGYGIEGLSDVLYIFDKTNVLAGVIMTMEKSRFDEVFGFLSGKYKVSAKQIPFVGNKFARLKGKGAMVELDAPHLSFTMEARYLRDDLFQQFNAQSEAEAQQKKASERSRF